MSKPRSSSVLMDTEPAVTIGTVTAAVTAILALAVSFGLPVSDEQQAGILAVIAVVFPLVQAYVTRAKVWSPLGVRREIAEDNDSPGPY